MHSSETEEAVAAYFMLTVQVFSQKDRALLMKEYAL